MKLRMALTVSFIAFCSLALTAQAAPPEGKGQGHSASQHGKKGNSGKGPGHSGKGNSGKGNYNADKGSHVRHGGDARRGGDMLGDLAHAGITAALAREYARDYGLRGYSSLPPGIRKNLARGKPLPPGIAKKMVPGSMLGRLPKHSGYEWRVAGTDLILISVATAVIADILYDVFD